MDDPIFDPWAITDGGEPEAEPAPQPPPPAREQVARDVTAGDSEQGSAPRWASPPGPGFPFAAAEDSAAPQRTPPSPGNVAQGVAAGTSPRRDAPRHATPHRPATLPAAERLADVLAYLRTLATRLEMAGHETAVDDRLAQTSPSVRFRMRPSRGPFDAGARPGSVLEFVARPDEDDVLLARLWLDELDPAPIEESRLEGPRGTREAIEAQVVDFVRKALDRA